MKQLSILIFLLIGWNLLPAQKVYVLELNDEIYAPSARYMQRGVAAAEEAGAALIIVHLDTYGGRVDHADSIRSALLDTKIPTAVFIDRNAASAGALISLSCDSIYMAPGASIGAATVVDGGTGEASPDKYQSYWRGIMRSTAEMQGRNPQIAEKMVDEKLNLEGISPAGQVITFSTKEAIQYDFCDGKVESLAEVAGKMGVENAEIVLYEGSGIDQAINFLIHPTVGFILVLLIFGGFFMELKTPGIGVAGLIGLLATALFFAPHYIEGLAQSWEIAVFVVGLLLLAVEIFVIPGFGVAGVLGILAGVVGLTAALLDNQGVGFEGVSTNAVLEKTAWVLVMMVSAILVVVVLARQLVNSRGAHPFVDMNTQESSEGYTSVDTKILALVGSTGVALTDLRPSGYIEVGGKKLDAECVEGYILKGQQVVVSAVRSIHLMVKKKDEDTGGNSGAV